jgi:5,10-methylenetetrahydromethanopterin reductase
MSQPVRIHLRVPGTLSMTELMALIRDIEAAGFDGAGILDSQVLARDAFVILAQAATQTSRLSLFPAVTNPVTRHATVLASAMQSVEELAPGRTRFIIGTGYTSASTIGRRAATLKEMRACVMQVKALLAGETVDFNGTPAHLPYAGGSRIPVLMAASGPKAIELAGEIADGVLLLVGFNKGLVDWSYSHLEAGARRAGRRVEDLQVMWAVRTSLGATTEAARRHAQPTAVHWGIRWEGEWARRAGIRMPDIPIPEAVHAIKPDLSHAPDWEAAIRATAYMPQDTVAELCDALGLIGTPEYCAKRIIEMEKLGVRELYLMPFETFASPEPELRACREVVFPMLRAAGLR